MTKIEWWKILIQTSPKHWSFLILLFFFWSITRIDTTLKWIVMNNSPIINGTKIDNSTLDVAWITSHNIQIFPTQRKKKMFNVIIIILFNLDLVIWNQKKNPAVVWALLKWTNNYSNKICWPMIVLATLWQAQATLWYW